MRCIRRRELLSRGQGATAEKQMSGIDFKQKISFQRPFSKPIEAEEEYDIVRQFESDRGRIVNSAAIRRLQQKTQVFPLERNAATANEFLRALEGDEDARRFAADAYANENERLVAMLARHLDDEEDLIIPLILDRGHRELDGV